MALGRGMIWPPGTVVVPGSQGTQERTPLNPNGETILVPSGNLDPVTTLPTDDPTKEVVDTATLVPFEPPSSSPPKRNWMLYTIMLVGMMLIFQSKK